MSKKTKALKRRGTATKLMWPSHKVIHFQSIEQNSGQLYDFYVDIERKVKDSFIGVSEEPRRVTQRYMDYLAELKECERLPLQPVSLGK